MLEVESKSKGLDTLGLVNEVESTDYGKVLDGAIQIKERVLHSTLI